MSPLETARSRDCRVAATLALILAVGSGARAIDAPAPDAAAAPAAAESPAAPSPQPPPIPVAEIPERTEHALTHLHDIVANVEASADLDAAEAAVAESGNTIWTGATHTNVAFQQGMRLSSINDLTQAWTEGREDVANRSATLTTRARESEDALAQIQTMRDEWARSREAARADGAPAEVLTQVDSVSAELAKGAERLAGVRDRLVLLSARTERQLAVSDEVLQRLDRAKLQEVGRLGVRNVSPIWQGWRDAQPEQAASHQIGLEAMNELRLSAHFLVKHPSFLPIQLVAFAALSLLLRRLRAREAKRRPAGAELNAQLAVLDLPYSVALLLTIMSGLLVHSTMPRALYNFLGVVAVVPVLRIARHFLAPVILGPLYVLVGLRIAQRVLEFLSPPQLLEQVALCLALIAGIVLLVRSSTRANASVDVPRASGARWRPDLRVGVGIVVVDFAVALGAAALGYLQLARLLFEIPLWISNAGLGFYTAARVLLGLWAVLLATQPLASLRMVQGHRDLIAQRSRTVVGVLAVAGWLFTIWNNLAFLGFGSGAFERMASASAHFGSVSLTVGDLVAAAVTVWVSFLLSRLVRFVLEEEVFPRVRLTEGVPYALSMLTHYTILATGLLLGLATLGFDPSRLTVIVGALGVGIGFGLQTIVNNLSSGLILLFERPVKVGDTIQVGAVKGEVKRIGTRSSTVRTGDGAEMIVPNASLVSETVTNWTLSDRSQRFELSIGVAYGTKPAKVMAMLKETAARNPEVLASPEPSALFIGFGASSLDFQLKAWVADGSRLSKVKSDVGLALCEGFEAAGIEIPFPQQEVRIVGRKES